jgi:hypothetical protein
VLLDCRRGYACVDDSKAGIRVVQFLHHRGVGIEDFVDGVGFELPSGAGGHQRYHGAIEFLRLQGFELGLGGDYLGDERRTDQHHANQKV